MIATTYEWKTRPSGIWDLLPIGGDFTNGSSIANVRHQGGRQWCATLTFGAHTTWWLVGSTGKGRRLIEEYLERRCPAWEGNVIVRADAVTLRPEIQDAVKYFANDPERAQIARELTFHYQPWHGNSKKPVDEHHGNLSYSHGELRASAWFAHPLRAVRAVVEKRRAERTEAEREARESAA